MRRYELIDGSSQKFWEISLEGENIMRRWGRLGSSGQSNTKNFPDEHHARRAWEDLISQKRNKGYQLVAESAELEFGADDESDESPEPRNEELEQLIFADPDDRDGYLVLGDWLLEQEHPRGELISANAQMVDQNDPVQFLRFKTIQTKLLAEHPRVFYGPKLKHHGEVLRIKWVLGYWRTLTVLWCTNLADVLASVAASPSALFLQELNLDLLRGVNDDAELAGCLSKLGEHPMRALSKLTITTSSLDGLEVLSQASPALRHLRVDTSMLKVTDAKWALPTLESLNLDLGDTKQQDICQLLNAVASPRLTDLELHDLSEANTQSLLSSAAMPNIKSLAIRGYNLRYGVLRSFIDCHQFLGNLTKLETRIYVDPKARDATLEREFAALYPFADLSIVKDGER
jgi:uncharacterized protein (TIGR02996 family)